MDEIGLKIGITKKSTISRLPVQIMITKMLWSVFAAFLKISPVQFFIKAGFLIFFVTFCVCFALLISPFCLLRRSPVWTADNSIKLPVLVSHKCLWFSNELSTVFFRLIPTREQLSKQSLESDEVKWISSKTKRKRTKHWRSANQEFHVRKFSSLSKNTGSNSSIYFKSKLTKTIKTPKTPACSLAPELGLLHKGPSQ